MLTQIRRTIEEVHWIDLNQDLQSIDIRPNQYQPLVCLPRVPTTGRPSLTRFAARGILGILDRKQALPCLEKQHA